MKIFGIGLSKTGTNSLVDALGILGFNLLHYPPQNMFEAVADCDGCADLPTCALYEDLDRRFPGSKFVLTVRNKEKWLNSVEKHFERRPPSTLSEWGRHNRVQVYGSLYPTRDDFARVYDLYHMEIFNYFSGRKGDLLRLNITDEEDDSKTWAKLAEFVGKEAPDMPFPHGNAAPQKTESIDVVIPYIEEGTGFDIRYAVRSAMENFIDLNRVVIVGDMPDCLDPDKVLHIPHKVKSTQVPELRNRNYCRSMWLAANHPELTDDFLYMADDHFILTPRTAQNFRDTILVRENMATYNQIERRSASTAWQLAIWSMVDRLLECGYSGFNYETHTPKLVNKFWLQECFAFFGYGDGKLIWQTAYFNMFPPGDGIRGHLSEESPLKAGFYKPTPFEDIKARADEAVFMNFNEEGESADVQTYLMERFPEPSPVELL